MNDSVNSQLQTYRRIDQFCTSHASDSGPNTLGARLSATLASQLGAVGDRGGSRLAINAKLEEPMITRRQLNPLMQNKYADDPATLAELTTGQAISNERRGRKTTNRPKSDGGEKK